MNLPGTEIHLVTFIILIIEVVLFFFQLFYYFQRTQEKGRLWYLLLLGFLIQNNAITGFFPDKNIPIPIFVQDISASASSIAMGIYFAFYFYKAFGLSNMKQFATKGAYLFLLVPFFIAFCIPYYITKDIHLSNRLLVVIPFFYALSFLYTLHKSFRLKYSSIPVELRGEFHKEKMSYAFIAATFWSTLPIVTFFEAPQGIACILTNSGFLIMTISYFRFSVLQSRKEYEEYKKLKVLFRSNTLSKNQISKEKLNLSTFPLSDREKEIVLLISEGKPHKEIAKDLNISYFTVKKHVSNIYDKLGVGNKIELINTLSKKEKIA